jgi:hypothetical protein
MYLVSFPVYFTYFHAIHYFMKTLILPPVFRNLTTHASWLVALDSSDSGLNNREKCLIIHLLHRHLPMHTILRKKRRSTLPKWPPTPARWNFTIYLQSKCQSTVLSCGMVESAAFLPVDLFCLGLGILVIGMI